MNINWLTLLVVLTVGVLCLSPYGLAQPVDLPGSADPGRITTPAPAPDSEKLWQDPAQQRKAVSQVPEGAADSIFILQDIIIEGMTAYRAEDVARLYNHHKGQQISVATLFDIMTALQQKYIDDGYTLTRVFIPNQNVDAGLVRLSVIEGYAGMVELAGDETENDPVLADISRRILGMRPLNMLTLERILLLANTLPGRQVGAILAPLIYQDALNNPGAVRVILEKRKKDMHFGSVGIDNYGSIFTGPIQMTATGNLYNIGIPDSTLALSLSGTTSFQEQKYAALQYEFPLWGVSGWTIDMSGVLARTEPGASLDDLDIRGKSHTLSARLSYALIHQRAKTWNIDTRFEHKNSHTDILDDRLYDDRLRVLSVGTNYSASDSLRGINLIDLRLSQGLDILGARETGSIDLSRTDGRSDFRKFNFYLARLQSLPSHFEIYTTLSGQHTPHPLLSAEEFGFGGQGLGRGYDPSEITGDRGLAGSLEFRHRSAHEFYGQNTTLLPYLFFDVGKVWDIDNGDTTHESAASAGAGLKINIENQWDISFMAARPLTRSADNPPAYARRDGTRFLMGIQRKF